MWSRLHLTASSRFVSCGLVGPRRVSDARMLLLAHAFIASRVDYCNSILYQTAAVHLRPLQLVLNAAARLVVKKRKWDSITPTISDNLHCTDSSDATACRLHDLSTSVLSVSTRSLLRTSCRWSVRSRQSLLVAICARQVRVIWLCHGQEQLASVHNAFQSLVR